MEVVVEAAAASDYSRTGAGGEGAADPRHTGRLSSLLHSGEIWDILKSFLIDRSELSLILHGIIRI